MISLTSLWLPILLSAIAVFVASSILHMLFTHHRSDYSQVPGEEKFIEATRPLKLPPGHYFFPYCGTMKETGTPEYQEKLKAGPVGMMTILPNAPLNMGKSLGCWFVYIGVVSIFAAYIAGRTLSHEAPYLSVFRVVGTVAFAAYALGHTHNSIWKAERWGTTFKFYFDGLIYSLLTAGFFGWLWPR